MDVEELVLGVASPRSTQTERKKRKLKRANRGVPNLGFMPVEVLESIFLALDPQTVCAATAVSRRFAFIGTNPHCRSVIYLLERHSARHAAKEGQFGRFFESLKLFFWNGFFSNASSVVSVGSSRFWMRLLTTYWDVVAGIDEPVTKRLALSKTLPTPQIHFLSFRHYALGVQDVAFYAEALCKADFMPFDSSRNIGLTLPHGPIRNSLARFYPDRQFYLAAYEAERVDFNFSAIVLNHPKEEFTGRRHKVHRTHSREKSRGVSNTPTRHFLPIGLKPAAEQEAFLLNFKNAKAPTTTDAMLLAQAVSSLLAAVHTRGSLGRISVRIPGLTSLPPPKDIDHFFVRSTILIAKIPSLALEFAFDGGILVDLIMHPTNEPWRFRD